MDTKSPCLPGTFLPLHCCKADLVTDNTDERSTSLSSSAVTLPCTASCTMLINDLTVCSLPLLRFSSLIVTEHCLTTVSMIQPPKTSATPLATYGDGLVKSNMSCNGLQAGVKTDATMGDSWFDKKSDTPMYRAINFLSWNIKIQVVTKINCSTCFNKSFLEAYSNRISSW